MGYVAVSAIAVLVAKFYSVHVAQQEKFMKKQGSEHVLSEVYYFHSLGRVIRACSRHQ